MLINWFTVAAQVVNFLILMALLKYFLFDRVVRAMDAREKSIQDRIESAERKQAEAEEHEQELADRKKQLESKKDQLLSEAKQAVEEQRKQWQDEARNEIEQLRERWLQSLRDQKNSLAEEVRRLAAVQVYAVCKRVLKDLADAELEERMVDRFLEKLSDLDKKTRDSLAASRNGKPPEAVLRSRFEMPASAKSAITRRVHAVVHKDLKLYYQTDEAMPAGIELKAAGKKVSWNIEEYLRSLEERTLQTLDQFKQQENTGDAGSADKRG